MDQLVKLRYQAITFLGRSRVTHGRFLHEARSMCGLDLNAKQAYAAPPGVECKQCGRIMDRKAKQGRVLEYTE